MGLCDEVFRVHWDQDVGEPIVKRVCCCGSKFTPMQCKICRDWIHMDCCADSENLCYMCEYEDRLLQQE